MAELITCNACGGSGAMDESSLPCAFCQGTGAIFDHGPPPDPATVPTERFNVTGQVTQRVVVKWLDGTEHTLYRPPEPGSQ